MDSIHSSNWRSSLPTDVRRRIVNMITDVLRSQFPSYGHEGVQELEKLAMEFEQNIYHVATSQSDYLRRISLQMLAIESTPKPLVPMPNAMPSNSAGASRNSEDPVNELAENLNDLLKIESESNPPGLMSNAMPSNYAGTSRNPQNPASLDSIAQTGNSDAQEVYEKITVLKDLYFVEIYDIYQKICSNLQQHEPLPQQANSEAFERLKLYKQMIERILHCLQISKSNANHFQKEKLASLEKQILNILNTHRLRKPGPPLQQGQIPPFHMQSLRQHQHPHSNMLEGQLLKQQQEQMLHEQQLLQQMHMQQQLLQTHMQQQLLQTHMQRQQSQQMHMQQQGPFTTDVSEGDTKNKG